MLEPPLLFTGCSRMQFFNSPSSLSYPPSPNTDSEAAQGYIALTVQHLYDLREAMPRHWLPSAFYPTIA